MMSSAKKLSLLGKTGGTGLRLKSSMKSSKKAEAKKVDTKTDVKKKPEKAAQEPKQAKSESTGKTYLFSREPKVKVPPPELKVKAPPQPRRPSHISRPASAATAKNTAVLTPPRKRSEGQILPTRKRSLVPKEETIYPISPTWTSAPSSSGAGPLTEVCSSSALDACYQRIRFQIDIQRASLVYLKLELPAFPLIAELYQKHSELEQSIDDLYFIGQSLPRHSQFSGSFLPSHTTSMTSIQELNESALYPDYLHLKEQWRQEQTRAQTLERAIQDQYEQWQASDTELREQCQTLTQRNQQLEKIVNKQCEIELDALIKELETGSEKERTIQALEQRLAETHQVYMTREAEFLFQLSTYEREMQQTLKEYDRLTRNISDFNAERKKLEKDMDHLQRDKDRLEKQQMHQTIAHLAQDGQTHLLLQRFQSVMTNHLQEHQNALWNETETKRALQQELRNAKAEVEFKRWERVHVAVQTYLDPQFIVNCSS